MVVEGELVGFFLVLWSLRFYEIFSMLFVDELFYNWVFRREIILEGGRKSLRRVEWKKGLK